ncbi:ComEC/Rec2 family competence protein [candidate division CSSED10-310 bacterium]|uniref:ComEC/Rec2 family competence protein n=1 Tax=candidate division CSSED10-310 bacterium TaxID=2855610 RepID=A0ABV6YVZ6_UNCC1
MQQKIISFSLFFIGGIIIGMHFPLPHNALAYCGGTALALIVLSLMLSANNQVFLPLFIISGLLAGWTNFSWRIDTTSPYHLIHYIDDVEFVDKTEVAGWIVKEPEIREFKTNVTLKPDYIRLDEKGKKIKISGGLVLMQLRPSMKWTYSKYQYGDYVVTRFVSLTGPAAANNPGVFDYQRFLRNNNIYGLMNIRKDYQLRLLTDQKYNNPVVDFALTLKKQLLWTIKKTMPHPESAFLGGILLGLRQGLSRTVQDEFRASGVAHVLAVSGLHVTIITALLFGLLTLFKVPRRFLAPPIIAGLIIFAIITGGRPSTLRAVIMNGIALISFCYLVSNLRTSLLFGISTAAMIILFFTPMILFEASFLYSFTAVLSLALLTGPLLRFFNKYLTSVHTMILFLLGCVLFGTMLVDTSLIFHDPPFALVLLFILFLVTYTFRKFFPRSFRFSRLPYWFISFTAAQGAIQLGLGPLNAFYFQKYSLAAPIANFLAIPLIGVNVQLGLIAGIFGFVPFIGDYLALVINASNWLAVKLFLGSASFFAHAIPYPDLTPPPMAFMLFYYGLLIFIAYQIPILDHIRIKKIEWKPYLSNNEVRKRLILASSFIILFLVSGLAGFYASQSKQLVVTAFDMSVFGMGGGSSQLVELPDERVILVDGGLSVVKKRGRAIDWNMGSMVLGRVLRGKRIRTLDWVVLTSPDAESSGGLAYIFESFYVKEFIDTLDFGPQDFSTDLDLDTFLNVLADDYFHKKFDSEIVQDCYTEYVSLIEAVTRKNIKRTVVQRGHKLYESQSNGSPLTVEVLHPPAERLKVFRTVTNNSLVLKITYGNFSCLIPAQITIDGEKSLLALGDALKADVMIAPFHGYKGSVLSAFVKAVDPELVVIQTLPSRYKKQEVESNERLYQKFGCRTLRTDLSGAIVIKSNGRDDFRVETMFKKQK